MAEIAASELADYLKRNARKLRGTAVLPMDEQVMLHARRKPVPKVHKEFAIAEAELIATRRDLGFVQHDHTNGAFSITFTRKGGRA
ncbi:MAG: hypothetical protein V1722_04585 [Candidatus Micrarchaeota archaeon]